MSWCTLDHIGTWDKTRWNFDTHCYIHIYAPRNLGRTKRGFSAVSTMLGTDQLIMPYVLESMSSLHLFTNSSCSAHYDCIISAWSKILHIIWCHHLDPFGSKSFKILVHVAVAFATDLMFESSNPCVLWDLLGNWICMSSGQENPRTTFHICSWLFLHALAKCRRHAMDHSSEQISFRVKEHQRSLAAKVPDGMWLLTPFFARAWHQ